MKKIRLLIGLVLVVVLALVIGYHGGGEKLSGEEVDHYLSIIAGQDQQPGGRHDLTALRDFLEKDDGQPFYTVNLYRFHAEAQYLPQSEYSDRAVGGSGKDAFERFSKVMIKLLASHSSHPIFASEHKWAALAANERMLVQGLHIPSFYFIALIGYFTFGNH